MDEKHIADQIADIREAAKENKNVDVASLMMHTLAQEDNRARVSLKTKKWLYLASLGLPPVGFVISLVYYFREEEDAKTVAMICAVLTVLALITVKLIFSGIASSGGPSVDQLQQIKPSDVQQLYQ